MLKKSREKFFETVNIDFKSNSGRLWSVLKINSKTHSMPELVSLETDNARSTADTPRDIWGMFNKYFISAFVENANTNSTLLTEDSTSNSVILDISLPVQEVQSIQSAAPIIVLSLTMLFNRSLGSYSKWVEAGKHSTCPQKEWKGILRKMPPYLFTRYRFQSYGTLCS